MQYSFSNSSILKEKYIKLIKVYNWDGDVVGRDRLFQIYKDFGGKLTLERILKKKSN